MHRTARYLPTLLLCLSAVAAAAWVRSHCVYDEFERDVWSAGDAAAEHARSSLLSARGTVFFFRSVERVQLQEAPATRPASSVSEWKSVPAGRERVSVDYRRALLHDDAPAWAKPLARLGLGYGHEEKYQPNRGDWPRWPITSTNQRGSLPYWLLVAATAAWPALLLASRATRAWVGRRRRRAGRCTGCGYDLRGSAGRCPECGAEPGATSRVGGLFIHDAPRRTRALLVGSSLTACVVVCIASMRTASGRWPPPLADERTLLDRMTSAEVRRLIAEIRHPGTSEDSRAGLYQEVAGYGTPEVVRFLAETYEEQQRIGRGKYRRELDLVIMLWGIRRPESADLLLRMLRDGNPDLRLVDAYTAVAGDEAVPQLRALLDNPPNETVRYDVWRAQLRCKEPRAVHDYLAQLRPAGQKPQDVQSLYDFVGWASAFDVAEAIPALRALAPHYPAGGSLRRRIVHTLLRLGDWASVPDAIELLAGKAAAPAPGAGSQDDTVAVLRAVTGEDLPTDVGRWRRWWEEQGRHQTKRKASSPVVATPPREMIEAVEQAFLTWAATQPDLSEPGPVVYVQVQGGWRRSTETIRYYREAELRLLDVPRIRIDGIKIDGDVARVSFYRPHDFHGPGPTAELKRNGRGWTVRGLVYESDVLPLDDPSSL
jgi:hypothetical protein